MSSFDISIGHLSIGLLILASMQTVHTGNRRQLLQTPRSLFSKEYGLFIMDSVPSGVICPMGVAREKSIAVHKCMQNRRTQESGVRTGISVDARPGVTHLSIGVIIYIEGLSVRHPKGARSIGIGHPRSDDRCTKTLPYPLDPLWVAEQSLQRPRQGVAGLLALPAPHSSLLDEWLRCLSNASPLISETKAVVKRRKIGTFEIYEGDGRGSYTGSAETARRVGGLR